MYLEICEVTNTPPKEEDTPIAYEDLMLDTQLAMRIVYLLPDKWDGASGTNMGKDLTILPYLLDLHEVTDKLDMIDLIMAIINEASNITNNKNRQITNGKK